MTQTYTTVKTLTQEKSNTHKGAVAKLLINTSGLNKPDIKVSSKKKEGWLLLEIESDKVCPFSGKPFYRLFHLYQEYKVLSARQENGLLTVYIGMDNDGANTVAVS